MEFIQHSINWAKGEILEAKIMAILGLVILICALLFWKFGITPNAKSLVIPLIVVGVIPIVFGITGVMTNQSRIQQYEKINNTELSAFVKTEKNRVEGFDNIFKYSYPFALICTIGGAVLFFLTKSPSLKSICIALMMIGLMAYLLDHFAAERANIYLDHIDKELDK